MSSALNTSRIENLIRNNISQTSSSANYLISTVINNVAATNNILDRSAKAKYRDFYAGLTLALLSSFLLDLVLYLKKKVFLNYLRHLHRHLSRLIHQILALNQISFEPVKILSLFFDSIFRQILILVLKK